MLWALGFGDVAEVDADAVPDVGGAAHAIEQDVFFGEVGGGFGVRGAPAVEAGFCGGFVGGLGDRDEGEFWDSFCGGLAGRLRRWRCGSLGHAQGRFFGFARRCGWCTRGCRWWGLGEGLGAFAEALGAEAFFELVIEGFVGGRFRRAVFGWGVGGLRGGAGFGGLDALPFPFGFAEVWGPGGVGETGGLVAGGEVEELVERSGGRVHRGVRVAYGGEAGGHGEDGEVGGVAIGDFVPVEGRGDAGVGERTDGVGGAGGAVFGVLVVVEEDAVAFLFPPFGGGEGGDAFFDGAGEGERGLADLGEGPSGVDADVDVDAAGAGGFGPSLEADLGEKGLDFEGDAADVVPLDAGAGVEIDAEFVGVVEVGGADGVRVELDAAEVDDPSETGGVVEDDLFGGAAGGKGEGDGLEPGRAGFRVRRAFLVEGFAVGAVDEALEDEGTVSDSGDGSGSDGEVVADEVELGELDFAREVEFAGVRDADFAAVDLEHVDVFGFFHEIRLALCRGRRVAAASIGDAKIRVYGVCGHT